MEFSLYNFNEELLNCIYNTKDPACIYPKYFLGNCIICSCIILTTQLTFTTHKRIKKSCISTDPQMSTKLNENIKQKQFLSE